MKIGLLAGAFARQEEEYFLITGEEKHVGKGQMPKCSDLLISLPIRGIYFLFNGICICRRGGINFCTNRGISKIGYGKLIEIVFKIRYEWFVILDVVALFC